MIGYCPSLDEMIEAKRRWNSLTKAEQDAEIKRDLEKYKEKERIRIEELNKERTERQRKYEESIAYMDHPNTLDNGTATFFYIAIMLIAIIFKERWFIWIAATIRYIFHVTRYERDAEMRKNKTTEGQ
jgi:hypothetical protein